MRLYIDNGVVSAVIQEEDPFFPGVPIEDRYAPDFLAKCEDVPEGTTVEVGWVKTENGFTPPPSPPIEPGFPPDPPAPEPTYAERVAALEDAMLTLMMGGA